MTATGLKTWNGWVMTAPAEPLQHRTGALLEPGPGEAVVAVAGCGVCHTDLAFLYQGVKTRHPPPLVLGHEISGMVAATGAGVATDLVGKRVLVPAVLPCGDCELCRAGRRTICRGQVMPGNDRDGGFASHLVVPARFLCPVPDRVLDTHELWELAVVSDAVSTPFQAVRRSGLARLLQLSVVEVEREHGSSGRRGDLNAVNPNPSNADEHGELPGPEAGAADRLKRGGNRV